MMLKKLLLASGFLSLTLPVASWGADSTAPEAGAPPLAEVCLLPDELADNTCAAFFLGKGGYQICLENDKSGKFRCSGAFSTDDEDDEEEMRPAGMPSDGFEI